MSAWYQVNPEALKATAAGINQVVEELKSITSAEGAEVGHGFDSLMLAEAQAGDPVLHKTFQEFCERWAWDVRGLVQDGTAIAERLHLSAGFYHDQEQYVSSTAKGVVSALIGANPNLTPDRVEKQSWQQVLSDNIAGDLRHPDFSQASFQQSLLHEGAAVKGEEADLLRNPAMGLEAKLLGADPNEAAAKAQARSEALNNSARVMGGGR